MFDRSRSWRELGVTYELLLVVSGIWFLGKFVRYVFPPLFEPFQAVYGVSNTTVGLAYTGLLGAYALSQFPVGVIADRISSVTVLVGGAVVAGIGAGIIALRTSIPAIVVGMVVIGVGTGVHKTVAITVLSQAYPSVRGRVLGVFDTAGSYGGVGAPLAVTAVLTMPLLTIGEVPWRSLFGAIAVTVSGLGIWLWLHGDRQDPPGDDSVSTPVGLRSYLGLFRDWRLSVFVVGTVLFGFAYNGVAAFLPLYLTNVTALSAPVANTLYAALFAVSVAQLATGALSDRIGRIPLLLATLGVATLSLVLLLTVQPPSAYVAGGLVVLFGVGVHGFRPVRGAYLAEQLPDRAAAGGLGLVRTLLMGAGAIAPTVVGVLADQAGFPVAFWVLAGALVGATVLTGTLVSPTAAIER